MKNPIVATAAAVICAGALAAAQSTTGAAGQQTTPSEPAGGGQAENRSTTQQASTTLTGCVYRERDIPGRTPNVVERAGVLEDYILAQVDTSGGQSAGATVGTSGSAGTSTAGATGTAGRAGSSAMYKLEFVDDNRLQTLVGKRVEVMGRIDAETGDQPRTSGATGTGTASSGAASGSAAGTANTNPGQTSTTGDNTGNPASSGQRAGQTDQSIGPDRIELPEFEVTSLREVGGTCPPMPTNR